LIVDSLGCQLLIKRAEVPLRLRAEVGVSRSEHFLNLTALLMLIANMENAEFPKWTLSYELKANKAPVVISTAGAFSLLIQKF